MRGVKLALSLVASLLPLLGQTPPAHERQRTAVERQRAALSAHSASEAPVSVERQKAAVARQMEKSLLQAERSVAADFFTLPWPEPPPMPFLAPAGGASASAARFGCPALGPDELDPILERSARENALTPDLLRAVVRRESAFRPCAVSHAGAMGLMQLMPATARSLGVADPFDPAENVQAGSRYLRQLLERYGGDLMLALSAYNAGPGRVDRTGGVPAIPETQDYVRRILHEITSQ
jgi:soluble lytic murein transglycosylase-like protein